MQHDHYPGHRSLLFYQKAHKSGYTLNCVLFPNGQLRSILNYCYRDSKRTNTVPYFTQAFAAENTS